MTFFAYLDPGSGSLIMQLLLGGVAGLAVTFRMWWSRVKSILRIGRRKPEPAEEKATS